MVYELLLSNSAVLISREPYQLLLPPYLVEMNVNHLLCFALDNTLLSEPCWKTLKSLQLDQVFRRFLNLTLWNDFL